MLALAAVDIEIPDALTSMSKEHPVCLADALELGPSYANFKIVSHGWRQNRAAMVMLDLQRYIFTFGMGEPAEGRYRTAEGSWFSIKRRKKDGEHLLEVILHGREEE